MEAVSLTQKLLGRGFEVSLPGVYRLVEDVFVSLPFPVNISNWTVFSSNHPYPCVVKVLADDVTLDLGGFTLSGGSETTQGLVLVTVSPAVQRFTLVGGSLRLCAIGVFLEAFCSDVLLQQLQISDFVTRGVLSYSPQGLTVQACSIGPNLSELSLVSQETFDLLQYASYVRAAELCCWERYPGNLKALEESHVVGIDVAPEGYDSPYPPPQNTGSGVVLRNVSVATLTLYVREHSIAGLVDPRTGAVTYAVGATGDVLPEWYLLRRLAAPRAESKTQSSLYPLLAPEQRPWTLTTDFPINVAAEGPQLQRPVWVRGVDRVGNPLRGAQGVLIAGVPADSVTLSDVSVQEPVVKTLEPRVLRPPPRGVEARDLRVTTKATRIAVVPAKSYDDVPPTACCPVNTNQAKIFASLFEFRGAAFSSRAGYPPGRVPPIYQGSVYGVNAPKLIS